MRAVSHYEIFVFDGNIQDIRAWQRHKKKRWVPFVFKGQESHAEFPLFTWVTGLDTNCLPIRSYAKSNGTDGRRKWVTACLYSVLLLPRPVLPFPLLPSTTSQTWISGLLCVGSTPFQHNERRVHRDSGNIFFSKYLDLSYKLFKVGWWCNDLSHDLSTSPLCFTD